MRYKLEESTHFLDSILVANHLYLEPRHFHSANISREEKKAYIFLDSGHLDDPFVNSALRDKSIDSDLACLSKTVSSVHCLSIVGWVPVMIVENHGIGSRKVDS